VAHVIAADVSKVIHDSAIIKETTMNIVDQLAKQNQILEQIAWQHAVSPKRFETARGKLMHHRKGTTIARNCIR
jgi:hypothetical protein